MGWFGPSNCPTGCPCSPPKPSQPCSTGCADNKAAESYTVRVEGVVEGGCPDNQCSGWNATFTAVDYESECRYRMDLIGQAFGCWTNPVEILLEFGFTDPNYGVSVTLVDSDGISPTRYQNVFVYQQTTPIDCRNLVDLELPFAFVISQGCDAVNARVFVTAN